MATSKKSKSVAIHPDDIADALEDALGTTNELLAGMLQCLCCQDCRGTGERPTRDAARTERCACRLDAAELLDALQDGDEDDAR